MLKRLFKKLNPIQGWGEDGKERVDPNGNALVFKNVFLNGRKKTSLKKRCLTYP